MKSLNEIINKNLDKYIEIENEINTLESFIYNTATSILHRLGFGLSHYIEKHVNYKHVMSDILIEYDMTLTPEFDGVEPDKIRFYRFRFLRSDMKECRTENALETYFEKIIYDTIDRYVTNEIRQCNDIRKEFNDTRNMISKIQFRRSLQ